MLSDIHDKVSERDGHLSTALVLNKDVYANRVRRPCVVGPIEGAHLRAI